MSRSLLSSALTSLLLPLFGVGGLGACATTVEAPAPQVEQAAAGEEADDDDEDDAEEQERKLMFAKLDLAVAELKAKQSGLDAERGLADAERELVEAQKNLQLFLEHEQPTKVAEEQLSLDRSMHRRELTEDELNELISMYAAEEFAELTKELVLKRGRKSLEFAERGLAFAEAEFALLQNEELPQRQRKLEQELVKAKRGVEDAQRALEVTGIEVKVALMKAQDKLDELIEEAAEGDDDDDDGDEE